MANQDNLHFDTKAIHSGYEGDDTGAVMPPIYLSSTFRQTEPGKPVGQFEYSRSSNPNRAQLEVSLATLEQGKHGLCFSSGSAALATLLHALSPGAHVIVGDDVYGGTRRLFASVFAEKGIRFTQVDCANDAAIKDAITQQTALIWLETPTNPMLKIVDIEAVCTIRDHAAPNALVFVDNTFATPYLQLPLTLGADGVCHSTTKYIGGHSDVVGGALVVNDEELAAKLRFYQNAIGAVPSPFDCFLLQRSLKTLGLRMRAHSDNAMQVVAALQTMPGVKKIYYPGLETHPNFSVAKKQMRLFGGMISVLFDLDEPDIKNFIQNLSLFTLAESLGGVESLVEHPAIMTHATIPAEQRAQLGIDAGLLRFSIGIEHASDLVSDIQHALEFALSKCNDSPSSKERS